MANMIYRGGDRFLRILVLSWCGLMLSLALAGSVNAQTYTVNFKETDIEELIRFVAQATDKTIIVDPKVRGKVQVISSKPVNGEELYDLFLSILEVHGYAAIEAGNVTRIIPGKDARTSPVPVVVKGETRDPNSEIITQVVQLDNISAAKLIPILRPLAPQQAHMAAYDPSNAIIISDTAANIARIREVIDQIDRSAVEETEVVELIHASAEEVVRMLEQLAKSEAQKGQADAKSLVLVADKRTNSVLINGDEMSRARIKKLVKHLDSPLQQSGNVRVIYLKYAKAKDLAGVLTKVVQNVEEMSGGDNKKPVRRTGKSGATIEADEGTNSLIITAEADIMSSLMAVIERLDIRRSQVLVEAIIVEMQSTDSRDLGIQWLFLSEDGGYGSSTFEPGLNSGIGAAALAAEGELDVDANDDDDGGLGIDDPRVALLRAITGTQGQVFGVGQLDENLSFNVVVNALSQDGNSNILSTPTLLTLDNEEASIVVGENVPFLTGSYSSTGDANNPNNPFQTIERENVGITLQIKPQINESDSIVLELTQEVSSLTGAAGIVNAADVITNERKIETTVLAEDGQTIVLGGLIKDDVQDSEQKVPLLGDIPFLGRLFRSNSSTIVKSHLMVFLRPTIIRDGTTLLEASAAKYRSSRDMQIQRREKGIDFRKTEELPLLDDWEKQQQNRYKQALETLEKIRAEREGPQPDAGASANGDTADKKSAATVVEDEQGNVTAKAVDDSETAAEAAESDQ